MNFFFALNYVSGEDFYDEDLWLILPDALLHNLDTNWLNVTC